ncbi:MAG: pyruvate kinase [Patescibacteria group bacterium]|jgi:pyruvate kinase
MTKRTKIVATIGPSSARPEVLVEMIKAGMDVARLNFSHGNYHDHKILFENILAASKKAGRAVAVMQDLQGPRIRVGQLPGNGLVLAAGERVVLLPDKKFSERLAEKSADKILPVQYERLFREVKPGAKILISDGLIELKVKKVNKTQALIDCLVVNGGTVLSFRGINLPGTKIAAEVITPKDREDLRFGLKLGVDWVALSFVQDAKDILALRKLINSYQSGSQVKIIAKIERASAIKNFDAILGAADGIMVARGDLGIELPAAEVPMLQKMMIGKCLRAAKPVVVATQMLESMMINPRPTRAEVSDIANAVIDHTDAVMLSGETATGNFPVESVAMMAGTIQQTEKSPYDNLTVDSRLESDKAAFYFAESVYNLTKKLKIKAIVVATASGEAARLIARFRPETRILALTPSPATARQLILSWGVEGKVAAVSSNLNKLIKQAVNLARAEGVGRPGDKIVVAAAYPCLQPGFSRQAIRCKENLNLVKVAEL